MSQRNVGIYIYDQAEVLDFAGPFRVFLVGENGHSGLCDIAEQGIGAAEGEEASLGREPGHRRDANFKECFFET